MAKTGPKQRTAKNTARRQGGFSRAPVEPTAGLTTDGRREFDRLVKSLRDRGTLERNDLGVVTEAARVAAILNKVHARDDIDADIKTIGILTSQLRGLRRELGLTTMPSRSVVTALAKPGKAADPLAKLIKIRG
jgi:hypothetical protein